MDCSCIKGNFDVETLEVSSEKFTVTDVSDWMQEARYSIPTEFGVEVIPPGSASGPTIQLVPFSSITVSKEDVSIKDGVYTFKVESCGVTYLKHKLVLPRFRCCLDQAWAQLSDKFHTELLEIETYITGTDISVEFNQLDQAFSFFKIAEKLLNNLKCDCNC